MRFSERYGYRPVRESLQVDSMSSELRNSLWSVLQLNVWVQFGHDPLRYYSTYVQELSTSFWLDYFKKPIDTLPNYASQIVDAVREYFFACEWYEVYDVLEFVAGNFSPARRLAQLSNSILQREASAYRFVNGLITPITDTAEINEIDQALAGPTDPVRIHLRRSLELLSDKANPDYRNSIKEAISGVESLVISVVGQRGTLGQLIKRLEDEIALHPALRTAFSSLYGYTSNQDGIRHAILDAKDITFEDAKFFLVVCSAFANFVSVKVTAKARASGSEALP